MNKIFGICLVAAAAVGAAVLVKKCLCTKKDEDADVCDDYDFECDLYDDCNGDCSNCSAVSDETDKSKSEAIFEQAVKTIDDMKTAATEFCSTVKEILAKKEQEEPEDNSNVDIKAVAEALSDLAADNADAAANLDAAESEIADAAE